MIQLVRIFCIKIKKFVLYLAFFSFKLGMEFFYSTIMEANTRLVFATNSIFITVFSVSPVVTTGTGADLGIFVRVSNLFWQKGVVNAGRDRGAVLLFS